MVSIKYSKLSWAPPSVFSKLLVPIQTERGMLQPFPRRLPDNPEWSIYYVVGESQAVLRTIGINFMNMLKYTFCQTKRVKIHFCAQKRALVSSQYRNGMCGETGWRVTGGNPIFMCSRAVRSILHRHHQSHHHQSHRPYPSRATITNRLIHIDCGAGFAGPKSTVSGRLRPPPTVDLSIDVDQPVRYGGAAWIWTV